MSLTPEQKAEANVIDKETLVYEVWVFHAHLGETMWERFLAKESAQALKARLVKLSKIRPVRIIERRTKFTVTTREVE